jgi:outer membrane protein OmpA-like peptidoglycan-associated protein
VKRAKSVYNYLINCQISPYNLTFKGYGESRPIASKDDENDENEDELNRRIEFEICN